MLTPEQLDRLVVVLVNARNPNNIGAAARAMSNFGFPRLRIVAEYDVPFHEARSAIGAGALIASAQQFATLDEAIADCALVVGTTAVGDRELHQPLRRLEAAAALIQSHLTPTRNQIALLAGAAPSKVAILFGSEKTGLSNDDLSRCNWLLRIPTRAEHISMNLGQAVALCLYELIRQTDAPPVQAAPQSHAPRADLDRLTDLLLETLAACGYLKPNPDATAQQKIRRLVLRLNPSAEDAEILLGILRQFLWKLASTPPPTR